MTNIEDIELVEDDFNEANLTENDIKEFLNNYKNNPVKFAKDICRMNLDKPQADMLNSIKKSAYTSVSAGHGVGKSTMAAVLTLWWMSTRPDCRVIITANTASQLSTTTWPALAQVLSNSLNKSWFEFTATKLTKIGSEATWFATQKTWSENNFEAFQGIHADSVLMIFDEASKIPSGLFEVAEGALTTSDCKMCLFGNPTRNVGYFYDTFNNSRWCNVILNSEDSRFTNKEKLLLWKNEYGEDSDFYRIRVRGLFPKSSSASIISNDEIIKATQRKITFDASYVKVLGVDIARFGNDDTVFASRYGLFFEEIINKHGFDAVDTQSFIEKLDLKNNYDYIVIDTGGVGGPIYDNLKRIERLKNKLISIDFGSSPLFDNQYANKRAEMYGRLGELIKNGLCLPNDDSLVEELNAQEYYYNNNDKKILIKKTEIKELIGRSPDKSDAVALTTMVKDLIFKTKVASLKQHDSAMMFKKIANAAKWS